MCIIWNGTNYESFYKPTSKVPEAAKKATLDWIRARNATIADQNLNILRAQERVKADDRFPGGSTYPMHEPLQIPEWCK